MYVYTMYVCMIMYMHEQICLMATCLQPCLTLKEIAEAESGKPTEAPSVPEHLLKMLVHVLFEVFHLGSDTPHTRPPNASYGKPGASITSHGGAWKPQGNQSAKLSKNRAYGLYRLQQVPKTVCR